MDVSGTIFGKGTIHGYYRLQMGNLYPSLILHSGFK